MISRIQFAPTTSTALPENIKLVNSSLSLFTPSWGKMFRFSTITLLIAGIAAAFFLEIPLLAGGLSLYGVFYFIYLLRGKAKKGSAVDVDGQSLQADGNVEKGKYQKALNEIRKLRKQIQVLDAQKKADQKEISDLRGRLRR